ncbi:MAG: hypothetical protein IPI28_19030 [Candidatus Omnitrophica bacterium]|nr:hypothetical protein [Candidatus Omnitrophota bacterium]
MTCPKCGKKAKLEDGYECRFIDGKPTNVGAVYGCHTCTQTTPGNFGESLIEIPFTFNQDGKAVI